MLSDRAEKVAYFQRLEYVGVSPVVHGFNGVLQCRTRFYSVKYTYDFKEFYETSLCLA